MGKYAAAVNNEVLGFMKDVRGMDQVKLTRQAHECKYFATCDNFGQYCTERSDICLEDKTRNLGYRLMESYGPNKTKPEGFPLFTLLCLLRPNQLLKKYSQRLQKWVRVPHHYCQQLQSELAEVQEQLLYL
jgi:hypothetical protein